MDTWSHYKCIHRKICRWNSVCMRTHLASIGWHLYHGHCMACNRDGPWWNQVNKWHNVHHGSQFCTRIVPFLRCNSQLMKMHHSCMLFKNWMSVEKTNEAIDLNFWFRMIFDNDLYVGKHLYHSNAFHMCGKIHLCIGYNWCRSYCVDNLDKYRCLGSHQKHNDLNDHCSCMLHQWIRQKMRTK